MICPHCGKKTQSKERCEYCKESTEFAARSNLRPKPVPDMKELPVEPLVYVEPVKLEPCKPKQKNNSNLLRYAAFFAGAAMLILCVSWLISFHLSMGRTQEPTAPEIADDTAALMPAEEKQDYFVMLERNLPQQTEETTKLTGIRFGEIIPELPDEENYSFIGWNTDPEGAGTSFIAGEFFLIPLAEDLTLYAQWVQIEPLPTEETVNPDFWGLIDRDEVPDVIPELPEITEETEPTQADTEPTQADTEPTEPDAQLTGNTESGEQV